MNLYEMISYLYCPFAKVEPLVKHTDCICYSYSYHIYLYREKYLYFCKRKKLYINKIVIDTMACCVLGQTRCEIPDSDVRYLN